jgi:hypothetical protein
LTYTRDDADAFYDTMLVATILVAHHFYIERVALVEDSIIEYQAGIFAAAGEVSDGLPDGIGRHVVLHEIPVYGIMRENRLMVGHIGFRVVYKRRNDELTIITMGGLYA